MLVVDNAATRCTQTKKFLPKTFVHPKKKILILTQKNNFPNKKVSYTCLKKINFSPPKNNQFSRRKKCLMLARKNSYIIVWKKMSKQKNSYNYHRKQFCKQTFIILVWKTNFLCFRKKLKHFISDVFWIRFIYFLYWQKLSRVFNS